jgi:type IV pilus assembly protein PilV
MMSPEASTMNAIESRTGAAPAHAERGMTLIEILVAIVVLSIGLLGLAGLQLKGLQVNQGSAYNWQAAILAEDMADRIRADTAAAKAGYYALPGTISASASAATAASIGEWQARVAALPGGVAAITPTPGGAPGEMDIRVAWDDTRSTNGTRTGSTHTVSATSTGAPTAAFTLHSEMY